MPSFASMDTVKAVSKRLALDRDISSRPSCSTRCGVSARVSGVRVSRVSGVSVKVRVSVALASVWVRAKGGRRI